MKIGNVVLKCPKCGGTFFNNPTEPVCFACGEHPLGFCDLATYSNGEHPLAFGAKKPSKNSANSFTKDSPKELEILKKTNQALTNERRQLRVLVFIEDKGKTIEEASVEFGVSETVIENDLEVITSLDKILVIEKELRDLA